MTQSRATARPTGRGPTARVPRHPGRPLRPRPGAPLTVAEAMDAAFGGSRCQLVLAGGRRVVVDTPSWSGEASPSDLELFVDPCSGPTIDVGCGPGRLAGALAGRGVATLGTDISREAVRQTRARGAHALRLDVFDGVPRPRTWHHVLLADGNIGIGGDPGRLLGRVRELLHPAGSAIVEVSRAGAVQVHQDVRLQVDGRVSRPFAWATVGVGAIHDLAATAGLQVTALETAAGRTTATLRPSGRR